MADIIMDGKEVTGVTIVEIESSDGNSYVTFRTDETIQDKKELGITEPRQYLIEPDSGYNSIRQVEVNVNIPVYEGEM